MKGRSTPPVASTLLEAMRAIGYSFESAIADLVDNSIAAECSSVDIIFPPSGEPYVAIVDDGRGMSPPELMENMRHGSKSPLVVREERDLGRFGLGLKTASLSQCRRLTVVTKQAKVLCGAEWDLDEVARTEDWSLLELEPDDISTVPGIESLLPRKTGTLVVWRTLDRALAGESDPLRALQDHIGRARSHLALVFHRFTEGSSPVLRLAINGMEVTPLDPFLRTRKGRQALPPESVTVDGQKVVVEAHILPHISKLTQAEIAQAGGEEACRKQFPIVSTEHGCGITRLTRTSTKVSPMTTSIELLWKKLAEGPVAPTQIRVAGDHPLDLFAQIDGQRRVGLLAISDAEPERPPTYVAVEILVGQRADGRWATSISLAQPGLLPMFATMCDQIVEQGRGLPSGTSAASFVLAQVARWHRLLALGRDGLLSVEEQQGIFGELEILREAAARFGLDAASLGWKGPEDAHQDFDLPSGLVEVKTIQSGAPAISISSLEQLDIDGGRLSIAVVDLVRCARGTGGSSLADAVASLRDLLTPSPVALQQFEGQLQKAGYVDRDEYDAVEYRISRIRWFVVRDHYCPVKRTAPRRFASIGAG